MTPEPYKLPEGWQWVRLGEVSSNPQYGLSLSASYEPTGPKFVRITDITSGQIEWENVPHCQIDSSTLRKYLLSKGDLLFARSGSVGAAILLREDPPQEAVFASYLIRVRVNPLRIDPEFLAFFIRSSLGQTQLVPQGAAQKNINAKHIQQVLIPLPPLSEQRRLVARIEALMGQVREARRLRQAARQETNHLWQAVLAHTFPRPGAELPRGWRWVRLRDVCSPTERRDPTKEPDQPFLYVDISSVDNNSGEIRNPKELLGKEAPSRARKVIQKDDVIFATTRPYLKNIAIVNTNLDNQICSTGFCVLRARQNLVIPQFLFYVCRSEVVVTQLLGVNMRGASYPAVTDNDVLNSLIPLPPLSEQRRLVADLEGVQVRLRALRNSQDSMEAALRRLEQTILEKAFRGEL